MVALSSRRVTWTRARRASAADRFSVRSLDPRATQQITYLYNSTAIEYSKTTDAEACKDRCAQDTAYKNKWWISGQFGPEYYMTAGPDASLQFKFQGSSVQLMGHVESSAGKAAISIDGSSATTATFGPPNTDTRPLYTMTGLDDSQVHTLKLTYTGDNSDAKSFFIGIRSFVVETTHSPTDQLNLSNQNDGGSSKDNDQTISIAAGLSGAFALLLVIIAFFLWWNRRRRQRLNASTFGSGRPSHSHRPRSERHSSNSQQQMIYPDVAMEERTHLHPYPSHFPGHSRNGSITDPFNGLGHTAGHSRSNSLGVMQPNSNVNSTTNLLPRPLASQEPIPTPEPSRHQHSHYAFDADHEPAAVPVATSMALDILPEPRPAFANRQNLNRGRNNGRTSPTNTHSSSGYESWTSSDFGPIPSPFVADAPPLPAIPAHLKGPKGRTASPLAGTESGASDEKRRLAALANAASSVFAAGSRSGPSSRQSTLPPRYSAVLE